MKRLLLGAVLALALLLAISVPALAAELQVPSQYGTIQEALNAANPGDTVLVAPGTYYETGIQFETDGVTLQGAGSSLTMIQGSGLWVTSVGPTSRIDGFSIRGLIRNYSSSLTISNNLIWGGIYNYYSSPYIEANIIVGYGAAIDNDEYCRPTITNNIIMGVDGIDNCLSSPTITNNTITTSSAAQGMFGIRLIGTDYPQATITNNIITNFADGIITLPSGTSYTTPHPTVTYNDFWDNDRNLPVNMTGAYNIFQNPEFVDPGRGLLSDFHLRPGSPCIDVGSNAAPGLPATDFGGDQRIVDGDKNGTAVVDIGAYEYWNLPPTAHAGVDQTVEQMSLQGTVVTLDGSGSYDLDGDTLSYSWTWDGGSTTGVSPEVVLPVGTTRVTLVVNDGTFDSPPDTVLITVDPARLEGLALIIGEEFDAGNVAAEIEVALLAKVDAALAALARGNANDAKVAINDLKALVNLIEAQTDKKITAEAAAAIIAKASAVIAALGG